MKAWMVAVGLGALMLAPSAMARVCAVSIDSTDQMSFSSREIKVAADCTAVDLTLRHTGKLPAASMGHNVVVTETANVQAVGQDGMKAGAAANFVAADDKRVIAHTSVVGGGAATSVKFPGSALKAGGDYSFFCSFPGHWAVMKGKLVVK